MEIICVNKQEANNILKKIYLRSKIIDKKENRFDLVELNLNKIKRKEVLFKKERLIKM